MASLAFPSIAKKVVVQDGTTYGYAVVAPAAADKPVFLLLHGYPSSSYDWRNQIRTLSAAGYGIIVPDLLGYGDTDAPGGVGAYRFKTMSQHMVDILDSEGVSGCIAVGHDWGCGLLSRLVTYIPDRLIGVVFLSLGREINGYETHGYWLWHGTEEAVQDCETHPASVFNLLYPADPEDWKRYFAPVDKAAEYVRTGQLAPLPSWFSLDEYTMRDRILQMNGYRGPLNWYKAAMQGLNLPDEREISEVDKECRVPTLLVVSDQDYVLLADAQSENTKKWAKDLRIEILDCGHWIQLERPDKLQGLLEEFAAEIGNGTS
ncbi:epoxide hydrolase [Colletotrichum tofieldiae]|uniref:Epoxide hydrolase n=2 Tax=Colletotrichum spaethianum species complex TaxID=2707349 RepID=A0A166YGR0_9PEZI|nr:epoxide hydrolase [Colletotrichum tofieldiae]